MSYVVRIFNTADYDTFEDVEAMINIAFIGIEEVGSIFSLDWHFQRVDEVDFIIVLKIGLSCYNDGEGDDDD